MIRRQTGRWPSLLRYSLIVAVAGVVTYGAVYGVTTWLRSAGDAKAVARGRRASSLPQVRVEGRTVAARVRSAVEQIGGRYAGVELSIERLSPSGVLVKTRWTLPRGSVGGSHYAELRRRIKDSREATILLLQTIARTNPAVEHLGAFEDRAIVPIWDREQVLAAGDPRDFRDFTRFSKFQFGAERVAGYFSILNDRNRR